MVYMMREILNWSFKSVKGESRVRENRTHGLVGEAKAGLLNKFAFIFKRESKSQRVRCIFIAKYVGTTESIFV